MARTKRIGDWAGVGPLGRKESAGSCSVAYTSETGGVISARDMTESGRSYEHARAQELAAYSGDEEREFWATYDSTDYVDWSRAKPVTFSRLRPSTRTNRPPASGGTLLENLKVLAGVDWSQSVSTDLNVMLFLALDGLVNVTPLPNLTLYLLRTSAHSAPPSALPGLPRANAVP